MDNDTERQARRDAARARVDESINERYLARRAREREEDILRGRAQDGLFTRRRRAEDDEDEVEEEDDDSEARHDDDEDRDDYEDRGDEEENEDDDDRGSGFLSRLRGREPKRTRQRAGAKRSVLQAIRQLPSYVRLLLGLISDARVSKTDRFFVIAAVAYILSPFDLIPDIVPFFGQVDDVFLLMIALQRLVDNAGRSVLRAHWRGNPAEVHNLNFARILSAAGFFLPVSIKRRLLKMAGFGDQREKSRSNRR